VHREIGLITTCVAGTCVEPDGCTPTDLPDGMPCLLPHTLVAQCTDGECGVVTCLNGFGNCDGLSINGCETDLNSSADNCGACGLPCGPGAPPHVELKCDGGECVFGECAEGWVDADEDCAGNGQCTTGCEQPGCIPLLGGAIEIPDDGIDNDCDGADAINDDSRGFYVDIDFPFGVACEAPGLGSRLCPFDSLVLAVSKAEFEQDWANPEACKKELYIAKGIFFETGPVAELSRPLLLLGGYERTAAGPWTRDIENNITFLESDFEQAIVGQCANQQGWAVVDGLVATPSISASGKMVIRRLNTAGQAAALEVIVEEDADSVHVLDSYLTKVTGVGNAKHAHFVGCEVAEGVAAAEAEDWEFNGNVLQGDLVIGNEFEFVDNVVAGGITGGADCTLAGSQVTGPVNGQADWELTSNAIVGAISGKSGWTVNGNTVTGNLGGQHDWSLDGNVIFGNVSGSHDNWDLTRNVIHGSVTGRHYWSLGVNVIFGEIAGNTKWTLGNNSVFSPFLASGALVTMQGPNWGLVNNVFVWSGPLVTPYQAIAEAGAGTDPKILRFNAFVRFDKPGGAFYLDEGNNSIADIAAVNQMADLPLCGFGNNIAISTMAEALFLCLEPLSPDFLKLVDLSPLINGGIQLGYACGGTVVTAPGTDVTGKAAPCGSARDIGAYEFCP